MAARKPSERRHSADDEGGDLNLVPIMAIMVILVPMLIFMFTFHQITVQRVMAPRRGVAGKKAKTEDTQKPLNLTVVVHKDTSFEITWEKGVWQDPPENGILIKMIAVESKYCGGEKSDSGMQGCKEYNGVCKCHNFPGLYSALLDLSGKLPADKDGKKEKKIHITTDDDHVRWEVISRTIDAVTCKLTERTYPDIEAYFHAKEEPGDLICGNGVQRIPKGQKPESGRCSDDTELVQMCEELFPHVVFSLL